MSSNVRSVINAALAADQPVILWGPPGTGKTGYIEALAASLGVELVTLIGSTLDPVDVSGLPVPDDAGNVRQSPPPWAMRIVAALAEHRRVWLWMDELSCAPPSVQAALLRVVHSRMVGDLSIKGCRVIAASNPTETAADGGTLPAAMAGRWCHVDWTVEVDTWIAGELGGWGKPVSPEHARAAASVCAYIKKNAKALLAVPDGAADAGRAWPSPRSWSRAVAVLAALKNGPKDDAALYAVGACVGTAAASEWSTYEQSRDLPDPEDILAGKARIPERGDMAFAAVFALAAAAISERPDMDARMMRAWEVLKDVRPDIALPAARVLTEANEGIAAVSTMALGLGKKIIEVSAK